MGGLEGFGFGLGGEVAVVMLHEHGGAFVFDLPEGGGDGFGSFAHEGVTHSGDFHSGFVPSAESGLAGGEGDHMNVLEQFGIGVAVHLGDRPALVVAHEDVGVVEEVGAEDAVGGDVEQAGFWEVLLEVGEGEGVVEEDAAGEGAGVDDRVDFKGRVGEGGKVILLIAIDEIWNGDDRRLGGADGEDWGLGGGGWDFVGGVGELGGDDGGEGVLFDEVLASGVECGDRDVSQAAVEGEGEMLGFGLSECGLEIGGKEVLVELLGGLVEGLGVVFVTHFILFFAFLNLFANGSR